MPKKKIIVSQVPQISKLTDKTIITKVHNAVVLHSTQELQIEEGGIQIIPTGIKLFLPKNTAGLLRSVSALFLNNNVYVHPVRQMIFQDEEKDEILVILKNDGGSTYIVTKGSPVAVLSVISVVEKKLVIREVMM